MKELVSIIMCTYNGQRYLDEQIESILNQDYSNFELIIVDDNSTDDTWKLLQKWQQQNPVIKIFRNEINLGYNKNFERAIQLGTAKFISLSDQDDIWLPEKISKTVNALSEQDIILAHCKSVRLEDNRLKFHLAKLHYHYSGNDTRKLFFFNQIMGHDMVFRRELLDKIIPIPEGMSYDWWIAVVATCYGRIAAVDEYLVHHRIHSQNNFFNKEASSKKKELDLDETLRLFSAIPALSAKSKNFLHSFLQLLSSHNTRKKQGFNLKLFMFLYRYRRIFFGHKKRLLPELSFLKNAIKYAKLNYRGKGISI